jgi:hypothetical protein
MPSSDGVSEASAQRYGKYLPAAASADDMLLMSLTPAVTMEDALKKQTREEMIAKQSRFKGARHEFVHRMQDREAAELEQLLKVDKKQQRAIDKAEARARDEAELAAVADVAARRRARLIGMDVDNGTMTLREQQVRGV